MSNVTAAQSGSVSGPVRIHTDPQHQAMTAEEKAMLKQNIQKLTNEQKHGILPIVQRCINKNKDNKTVEFELDQLTPECSRELERYVNEKIKENNKKQKRKEADRRRREANQQQKMQQQMLQKQHQNQQQLKTGGLQFAKNQNIPVQQQLNQNVG